MIRFFFKFLHFFYNCSTHSLVFQPIHVVESPAFRDMILYVSDNLDEDGLLHCTKVTQLIKELYNEAMRHLQAELQVCGMTIMMGYYF